MTSNIYQIKTLFYCRAISKSWVTVEALKNCQLSLGCEVEINYLQGNSLQDTKDPTLLLSLCIGWVSSSLLGKIIQLLQTMRFIEQAPWIPLLGKVTPIA